MIANFITSSRILFSLLMLNFSVFSKGFYVCYLLAGFSDMIYGTIARKLGTNSKMGEKLDTIADFIFVVVSLYKLLPVIKINKMTWIWIILIALIKLINIISGYVIEKQFVTVHSLANKISGFVLFIFPLTISFIDISYSSTVVCLLSTFSAIQEGHIIRTKENDL